MIRARTNLAVCAVAGIVALLMLPGCGKQESVLSADEASFPAAVKLYQNGCITCHGDQLQGGIGPNLQHVGSRLTPSQIQHQIEVGSGPMPAYGAPGDAILTPSQIQTLVSWLSEKK